ncbi:MAG: DUF1566 domain-containing protein, partial [Oleispira sp.]
PDVAEVSVVKNLKAKPADQEISLTFSSDRNASQYEVFISTKINNLIDCSESSNECRSVLVKENEAIFNQLDNAQQYSLWVRALNAEGNSGEVSAVIRLSPDQYTRASNTHTIDFEQSLAKLSNEGEVLEEEAANWHCVFDNNSKLVWEVKHDTADFNTRYPGHVGHKYAWKNTDAEKNLGQIGSDSPDVIPGIDGRVFCDDDGSDALLACNTEAYAQLFNREAICGFSDWRLPTAKELQTIISYTSNDLFDTQYFPLANQQQGRLWTEETAANTPENAIVMDLKEFHGELSKARNAIAIRLVRGNAEAAKPIFRFVFPRGEYSFVDDVVTRLQWRICSEGTTRRVTTLFGIYSTYCIDDLKRDFYGKLTDVDGFYTFEEAIAKQKSGWRLPTLAELKTLAANQQDIHGTFYADPFVFPNAALSSDDDFYKRNHFVPEEGRNEFWSATEDPADSDKVFTMNLGTGEITKRSKNYYARARLVK